MWSVFSLLLACAPSGDDWRVVRDLDLYAVPGLYRTVMVGPERGFFVDNGESRLVTFHLGTGNARVLAEQGVGPGDLDRPRNLRLIAGRLWIGDNRGIQVFDVEGRFLKRYVPPVGLRVLAASDGWFGLSGMAHSDLSSPLVAYTLNEDFGEKKRLGTWTSEVSRGKRDQATGFPMPWNPAESFTIFSSDPTGRFAYVMPRETDHIHIFSTEAQQEIARIDIAAPRRPFDEAWGTRALEAFKKDHRLRALGSRVTLKPDFPSHFPLIRTFSITPEGRVVVVLWGPNPALRPEQDAPEHLRAFDLRGNEVSIRETDRLWHRLIDVDEKTVTLWVHDPETETAFIARTTPEALPRLLATPDRVLP